MASIFGHAVAAGVLGAPLRPSWSVVALGVFCAVLPDADVAAFALGIPYEHPLGHRGLTHSIVFALGVGGGVWATARLWRQRRRTAAVPRSRPLALGAYAAVATLSHGVLDAMTTGGLGVGFLIPFSGERFFFPLRPIAVSPIGAGAFFSARGVAVLASEALWIGLPSLAFVGAVRFLRQRRERRAASGVGAP